MKKLLLTVFALIVTVLSINATDFNIDCTTLTWDGVASKDTVIKASSTPFAFAAFKKGGATNPTQNSNALDIRVYAKGLFTVKCSEGKMTSIVFTISTAGKTRLTDVTASTGNTPVVDATKWTVTWTGSADSVSFKVGDLNVYGSDAKTKPGQFCFNSIAINTDVVAAVEAPTFSVKAGNYTTTQNVELTTATEGASIYYTTDDTDPTAASALYSSAIEISKTTTLKAIAIKGTNKSNIASATYTFPTTVASIKDFIALDDNTYVKFSNPITAIIQSGSNLYATDGTGYFVVYGNLGQTYNDGDIIPGGFMGIKTTYNSGAELKSPVGFTAGTAGTAVEPEVGTIDETSSADAYKYVIFKNVKFTAAKNTISLNGDSIIVYNKTFNAVTLPAADTNCDITGIITIYGGKTIERLPTAFKAAGVAIESPTFSVNTGNYSTTQNVEINTTVEGASIYYTIDGTDPTSASTLYSSAIAISATTTLKAIVIKGTDKSAIVSATYTFPSPVASVKDFIALDENSFVKFSNPITAIIQSGKNLYATDGTGYFVIYGDLGQTYKDGDVIPAGFSGTKVTYNNGAELKSPAGFAAGTTGTAVQPIASTIKGLTTADAYKYVIINQVKFVASKSIIAINSDTMIVYNNTLKAVTLPTEDMDCDITGIITVYKGKTIEIMPTAIAVTSGIKEVNSDKADEKTFDLVGRRITVPVKGQLYIKGGKKYIAR